MTKKKTSFDFRTWLGRKQIPHQPDLGDPVQPVVHPDGSVTITLKNGRTYPVEVVELEGHGACPAQAET